MPGSDTLAATNNTRHKATQALPDQLVVVVVVVVVMVVKVNGGRGERKRGGVI